ncbi:PstS family phosphate ABC transporter substrate-binding protein [[Phormidium] sp. ETS-05]|uniref:PstS family phosphate ABC transporter substrate-binding protein n=1 Tax=[Phormidium] sp. ETS-05 TaxID=222819 RepID=UPI001E443EBD|nr:PstS family phosphate ABC transporter substrate-binding protein [[Phormidium] sp. ETS-05]
MMNLKLSLKCRNVAIGIVAGALTLSACSTAPQGGGENTQSPASSDGAAPPTSNLSGQVLIDGSSTVFPISEAMAEEFMKANPSVKVTVGVSGTGGGFKKFCAGETDISNASRPIKPSEVELCSKNNIEYVELPVAFDGLSVVLNPKNTWAACLKVDELKKMWEPAAQGQVNNWSQIRPDFPDREMRLYGAGTDSGTYDYFTEAVNGKEGESRGDYTASEDDNVIVQGVAADEGGLGFFGFAYYEENKDKLKVAEIDGGSGCVAPTAETIANGTYQPLSRPIFVYVKKEAINRPEVKAFMEFNLAEANKNLITEAGYVPLPTDVNVAVQNRFKSGKVGSIFEGKGSTVGVKLVDLLTKE